MTIHSIARDLVHHSELGLAHIVAMDKLRSGIGLLDRFGRLLEANAVLREVFDQSLLLTRTQFGLVCASSPSSKVAFDIARYQAALGDAQIVRISDQKGGQAVVRFVPLATENQSRATGQACTLMTVRGLDIEIASPSDLAQLFDLTPREADLAIGLIRRKLLDEIAREMRITIATARVHLRNMFAKTGTGRQSELVALLMDATAQP